MAAKTLFFVFNSNKKLLKKAKCYMTGIDNESLEGDAGYFVKIGNALLWRMSLPWFFGGWYPIYLRDFIPSFSFEIVSYLLLLFLVL